MKKLKDLSKEQVIEIVKLVYPFEDWIKSEIEVVYQPYDVSWYEDAAEYWFAKFDGYTFGDKIDTYRLWIHPNLNVEFDVFRDKLENFTEKDKTEITSKNNKPFVLLGHFPIRNQHKIQKKFIEWEIEPEYEKVNRVMK